MAAHAQGRDNKLNDDSFSRGTDVIADRKLEQEFKAKKDEIEQLVAANPLLADTELVKNLRDQFDLLEKIARLEANRRSLERHARLDQTKIDHPSLDTSDDRHDNIVLDRHQFEPKSVRKAESERNEKAAEELAIKKDGGDTRAAHQATLDAEGRYREAAIDEELKTPEERAQERRQERARDQAEQRLVNRTQRHREAQAANGAMDPIGDVASIPDNAGMNFGDIGNAHLPSRSFVPPLPDRRPDIHASHANAGKGDTAGKGSPDVVAAIRETTAAVKGINHQRRA